MALAMAVPAPTGAVEPVRPPAALPPPTVGVSLVISGGVSLGAYQAGGTWAELERLSRARSTHALSVVTGASAGNINAFLAAIYWCDGESPAGRVDRTVFANPFFDVWANIGWDKLLPTPGDGAAYARLFEDAVGSATFRTLSGRLARSGGPTAPWFDAPSPYTDEDGLFTRSAFAAAEAYLSQRLVSARTAEGTCDVAVGVTVTRGAAAEYPLETVSPTLGPAGGAEPLTVPTQRYVVPLRLEVTPTSSVLRNALAPSGGPFWESGAHRRLARALHLPARDGDGEGNGDGPKEGVPPALLLRLVKASSAFPVVFAPIRLDVCLDPHDVGAAPATRDPTCPPGTVGVSERFADGGFFDNVPLGLAMELVDARTARGGVVEYLYVDPESRRGASPATRPQGATAGGLDLAFDVLGSAIDEARTFELQGLARHAADEVDCAGPGCPAGTRRFRASSRYHPIVGAYLVHNFAAFTHRVFRVHDYLVGVYDTLFVAATPSGPTAPTLDALDIAGLVNLIERFAALVSTLGLDREVPQPSDGVHRADELLWRLLGEELADRVPGELRAEYCAGLGRPRQAALCTPDGRWRTTWPCLSRGAEAHRCPAPVAVIHETLRRLARGELRTPPEADGTGVVPVPAPEEDFEGFVRALGRALAAQGLSLPPSAVPGANALAYDDGPADGRFRAWSRTQKMRFLERARAVERRDARAFERAGQARLPTDAALFGVDMQDWGLLALRIVALVEPAPRERLNLDPSTVDAHARAGSAARLLHLFPWLMGYDARHIGPVAGWEPRLDVFDSPVTPRVRGEVTLTRIATAPAFLPRAGAGFGVDGWLGATAMLTLAHLPAAARPGGAGGGVALGLDLARTVRLTAGVDRLFTPGGPRAVGADAAFYLHWAFLDVNGGLAWLLASP